MSILEFSGVTMSYGRGQARTTALRDVSCSVPEGALSALVGPSGAGKSTLLKLALAMERPDQGTIRVAGRDIHRLRSRSIPYFRRNVGAVFQDFKLLPEATPLENVALALQVRGLSRAQVRARGRRALDQVRLDPDTNRPVCRMSGGEQQRVAIARALAGQPALLLADEPTGNLDPQLSLEILQVLAQINRQGTTVVLATHDPRIRAAAMVSHEVELRGGSRVNEAPADRPEHSEVEAVA